MIPRRFLDAYDKVAALEQFDPYLGAFIFGSVAEGQTTDQSDLDVNVIVTPSYACPNINHPFINDTKLDISFLSMQQLQAAMAQTIQEHERPPTIAQSIIIFDKTGLLTQLRDEANELQPAVLDEEKYQFVQFMCYHLNNKVERNLGIDPPAACYAMHVGINDVLHYHYQLHAHWWVSSKRVLLDLRAWDRGLAHLVEQFVQECDIHQKFIYWSHILDYVLQPLGGRQPIAKNNCTCTRCQEHLSRIVSP